jgi:hypothetical protein
VFSVVIVTDLQPVVRETCLACIDPLDLTACPPLLLWLQCYERDEWRHGTRRIGSHDRDAGLKQDFKWGRPTP